MALGQPPGVQPGHVPTCDVAELFNAPASRYQIGGTRESHKWQAQRAADLAAPAPGELVLDVACGTGLAMRACARAVGGSG
jgi:ubiquinone/menaquinone biosynthesis C-methylase UbiE